VKEKHVSPLASTRYIRDKNHNELKLNKAIEYEQHTKRKHNSQDIKLPNQIHLNATTITVQFHLHLHLPHISS